MTFTAGEVKNPRRNLPLSLFLRREPGVLLYLLANVGYLLTLPLKGSPHGVTVWSAGFNSPSNDRVATAAAEMIFGPRAAVIMAILIMVSTFGCINGLVLAGARVYYAMARDGLFFREGRNA